MHVCVCVYLSSLADCGALLVGYKTWKGQVLNAADLADVYEGLQTNALTYYSHLLTGNVLHRGVRFVDYCLFSWAVFHLHLYTASEQQRLSDIPIAVTLHHHQ